MSTELRNEFKDNWDGMKPLQPALPNVEFVKGNLSNSFGGVAMASSPVMMPSLQNVMNPPEPIVVPERMVDMSMANSTSYSLRNGSFESSKMGDVQYLGASVASTMTELFGSLKGKEPEMEQFDPSVGPNGPAPQLALNNFAPKPPGVLFG